MPTLTPETLVFGLKAAMDPQLAPDGGSIAYELWHAERSAPDLWCMRAPSAATHGAHAPVGGNVGELWCCDLDGGGARRLTAYGAQSSTPRWSPDGERLAFVSDAGGAASLYVMPARGDEPRLVTSPEGRVSDPAWSPDSRSIAFTALVDSAPDGARPGVRVVDRLDYREDLRGFLGSRRSQIHVVDVETGVVQQLSAGRYDHFSPRWSPDGRALAAEARTSESWCSQMVLIDREHGSRKPVGPPDGVIAYMAWSPDGEQIAVCGEAGRSADGRHWDVFIFDVHAEGLRRITCDLPWAIRSEPVWMDDTRLLLHGARRGGSRLYALNTVAGRWSELAKLDALATGLSVDGRRRYAVQASESTEHAGEIRLTDLASGESRLVTAHNRGVLSACAPASAEPIQITRAGLVIDAWLLRPRDLDPTRRYPVVLDVHGGPQSYVGFGFDILHQCLAANGFLVIYANTRGSASYGADFARKIHYDWLGEDFQEQLALVDAVVARTYADGERVGIMGSSYGGLTTAWAIGQSDRFNAAVASAPVFDYVSHWGTNDFHPDASMLQKPGPPYEHPEWWAEHSPSTHAHKATTPTLILHAEGDLRVPIGQSEQMFTTLTVAGCETRYVRYEVGDHLWFHGAHGVPEHRLDVLEQTLAWFKRHLGEPV